MVNLVLGIASKVGVNPMLLLSICNVETGLKNINNYHDHNGPSFGVAQIKLQTAKMVDANVNIKLLNDPRVNVTIAAKLLKTLVSKYGNNWNAVAAYNAGSLRYRDGTLINKVYVDKVKKTYYNYNKRLCLLKGHNDKNKIQEKRYAVSFNKAYSVQ